VTARLVFACAALAAALAGAQPRAVADAPAAHQPREASLGEYRAHLTALAAVVEACARAREMKACDPALVGEDDRIPLGNDAHAGRRLIRYGWLRVLLSKAQDKDEAAPKPGAKGVPAQENSLPPRRTTAELLQDAKTRLARELAQADAGAEPAPAHLQERAAMRQVLAGRDFRTLEETTAKDTVLEKLANWLNRLFESAAKLRASAAWVGRTVVVGFIVAVCVGLIWGLMQLERRWHIRLAPESAEPAATAASARGWQLWLEDARQAAAAGQWREAIHFAYWAAISRLEAKRLWPADRARTPREYLALVAPEDARQAGLAALTGSFERVWYGGRAAGESDYRKAEALASALIAGSGTSSTRPEGGAAQ